MNLFEYTDYRKFLHDYYTTEKQKSSSYSYRVFAHRAKLTSPNYLKLVIDGSRRITDRNLPSFIRGLKLGKAEADYFKNIVLYEESKDLEAKKLYLEEALKIRAKTGRCAKEIDTDGLEYMQKWYHAVIREMVLLDDFVDDPSWVVSRLKSRITPTEAAESLKLLKRLKFIKKDGNRWVQTDPLITTQDGVASLLLRELHRQFVELAVEALFKEPVDRRLMNGVTLAIPTQRVPEVMKMISEFRRELNQKFSAPRGNQEVYQFMVGFFPVTRSGGPS